MSVAKRILLVDDDGDLREALAEQLMMIDDFDVFEADTGQNGVDRAKDEMHDLSSSMLASRTSMGAKSAGS